MSIAAEVRMVAAVVSSNDEDILELMGVKPEVLKSTIGKLPEIPQWMRVRAIGKVIRCLNDAGFSRTDALSYARDWIAAIDEHMDE